MALPIDQLRLRTGDISITATGLSLEWQVYHPGTSSVIESGRASAPLNTPTRIQEAYDQAVRLAGSAAASVYDKHRPQSELGGYSVFDADLVFDSWLSDPTAGTLTHPLSGTFSGVTYDGIVALGSAILARVLGPVTWWWAESAAPLQLRVKCVAAPGATSYNVYDGTHLLGSVPNANWNTLTVAAGTYSVRIAPVKAGIVGIASFPIGVTVAEGGAQGVMAASTLGEPDPSLLVQEPEPTRWQRVKAWFRETFGSVS